MAAPRSGRADQPREHPVGIGWRRIAAPGDILVGPDQREIAAVESRASACGRSMTLSGTPRCRAAASIDAVSAALPPSRSSVKPLPNRSNSELPCRGPARPVVRRAAARHAGRRVAISRREAGCRPRRRSASRRSARQAARRSRRIPRRMSKMRADLGARCFALRAYPARSSAVDRHVGEVLVELARGDRCCARRPAGARSRRIAAGWPAPALHQRGELPGKVRSVVHAGVHAEAAGRREQMRGIARQDDAAGDETFGHQRNAGGPRPMIEHLIGKSAPTALRIMLIIAASVGGLRVRAPWRRSGIPRRRTA